MSNQHADNNGFGFPKGNTVAIVGDPGTGKTTFLLTFFKHACLQGNDIVRLDDDGKNSPMERLCNLVKCNDKSEKEEETDQDNGKKAGATSDESKSIHVFISLESTFERLHRTNEPILSNLRENDIFVFVDATAMLSGKLEDRLRYPQLKPDNGEPDNIIRRSLLVDICSGHDQEKAAPPELRCLFWEAKNGRTYNVENSEEYYDKDKPKQFLPEDSEKLILLDILSPPIVDPFERVRLLKDLLAEIFSRYRDYEARFLAIDSLSALLSELDDRWRQQKQFSTRRLNILNLVRWLEEQDVTTWMACEARRSENATLQGHPLFLGAEERYLSSGIIQLDYHRYRGGDVVRYLRVMKMRGASHDMRAHFYELGPKGIEWLEILFGDPAEGSF